MDILMAEMWSGWHEDDELTKSLAGTVSNWVLFSRIKRSRDRKSVLWFLGDLQDNIKAPPFRYDCFVLLYKKGPPVFTRIEKDEIGASFGRSLGATIASRRPRLGSKRKIPVQWLELDCLLFSGRLTVACLHSEGFKKDVYLKDRAELEEWATTQDGEGLGPIERR